MNEAPQPHNSGMKAVEHEIREEHGDAAEAQSVPPEAGQVSPEEFEKDPVRNPDNEALKER